MPGRIHSREFKLTIVRQLSSGEKRPAQVCREHNLAASMVSRWQREYAERGEAAFSVKELSEVEALQAKVAELECRKHNKRAEADEKLREAIEPIVLEFAGYGYRRVTQALVRAGWSVNHKRVLRVMREASLLCRKKRRFVYTTDSQHPYQVYPNLVKGLQVTAPDTVWVADITYIRLPTTFVYLAAILDAYSRKCVGWKLSRRIDGQLALEALEAALATRYVSPGLIHHSDRGVKSASTAYVDRLTQVGARVSMSAVGNPYDNAKAESFFKTLKQEEVYLKQYQTFQEAEADIQHFIEEVYNTKRLHSSLGYVPPAEFEMAYAQGMRY